MLYYYDVMLLMNSIEKLYLYRKKILNNDVIRDDSYIRIMKKSAKEDDIDTQIICLENLVYLFNMFERHGIDKNNHLNSNDYLNKKINN